MRRRWRLIGYDVWQKHFGGDHVGRRQDDSDQRQAGHDRRRHAEGLALPGDVRHLDAASVRRERKSPRQFFPRRRSASSRKAFRSNRRARSWRRSLRASRPNIRRPTAGTSIHVKPFREEMVEELQDAHVARHGRGPFRPSDRLRQCGESLAGARRHPHQGDRDSPRSRRRPRADRARSF